jgi:uncharacterized SAM-binding protein YcdF (DUF218 family)
VQPRPRPGAARRLALALACALALADLTAGAVLLLRSRACCAQQAERVEANQLIVILYGAGPDREARIAEAVRLLRLQPSAQAFCAGGARPKRNELHCVAVAERLAQLGFDRARVSADTTSFDTGGNIAAAFAAAGPEREPLIVSDALHLARVRLLARRIAPGRAYHTSATPEPGGLHLLVRLQWEIAAYASTALPDVVRQALVDLTRD